MRHNPRVSDLVPFNGDRRVIVEWSNFSNPFCFVMKRLFHWQNPIDEFWLEGISHSMLDDVTVEDVRDLKHIGQKRFDQTVDELREVFRVLETELEKHDISLAISSPSSTYEDQIHDHIEDAISHDPIDSATTIEELRLGILNHFDLYKPIDERVREIILARHYAFGNQEITLESLGERFGITRERVRQIAAKYDDLVLSSPRESNDLLEKILSLALESSDYVDFAVKMTEEKLTEQEDFSIVNAVALCEILQLGDLCDSFLGVYEKWEERHAEIDEQTKKVAKYRSKVGLIDLEFMCNNLKISLNDGQAIVLRAYPRSIYSGKYALARTEKRDTTFENILFKQLLVSENVSCEDLVEGIRRHAIYRKADLPGENADFTDLVGQLAGDPPQLEILKINSLEDVELSDTDHWLLECFDSREKKMLHRSELVQMAFESGKNTASIGVYTLFSPLLRNCGQSIYTTIGNQIPDKDVRVYAEMIRKNFPDTEISYIFEGENVVLSVLPNINALGGVIFPPKELYRIVQGTTFNPTCTCEKLSSKQKIQFSVSNFWMGFSSIFKHAIDMHSWDLKKPLSIALDFDTKKATLRS